MADSDPSDENSRRAQRDDDLIDARGLGTGVRVPTLTFLVGLGLGAALVWAAVGGGGDDAPEVGPSATAGPSPSSGPSDTLVTVPGACEDVSARVSEAYDLLRDAVRQVRDFQAEELTRTLDELEVLDEETRSLAAECSQVSATDSPAPSETPETPSTGPESPPPAP